MKMSNLSLIFSLVFLFFLSSCGNDNSPLGLNNGEKWKINAEMMPPLKASEKLLSDFNANEIKDYKALAKSLKENNTILISSCTMSGKSHDELHKWLHPYMGLVEELSDVDDEKAAKIVVSKIEASFKIFDQYFQ